MMIHIVFVGYRKEAILLAKKKGYIVSVWSERILPASAKSFIDFSIVSSFTPTPILPIAVQTWLQSLPPISCFLALTESAVIPAAVAKQAILGIDEIALAIQCHDKYVMKQHANQHHIITTEYCLLDQTVDFKQRIKDWGLPIYAKPRTSSGGRGLHKVETEQQLRQLKQQNYLLEKAITMEELSIELFVYQGKIIFLNLTKYFEHHSINIVPRLTSDEQYPLLYEFAEKVVSAYGIINQIVHIECFIDKNTILLGELAIRPPGGYLMNLIKLVYDFDPWQALIDIALGQQPYCQEKALQHAAVYIFHPGAGMITDISGINAITELPGFYSYQLKKKSGATLSKREGSGQSLGYFMFIAPEQEQLITSLLRAKELLKITLQ